MCAFLSSVGGVGFALYSVREKLVKDGVLTRLSRERVLAVVCGFAMPFTPWAAAVDSASLARQGSVLPEEAIFSPTHW
jgi:hypothetical protein